jgi:hypothetical protein
MILVSKKGLAVSVLSGFALGSALIFGLSAGQGVNAQSTATNVPVVVELFTSQGCSSCPPADAFVEELAGESAIVAITRPVTYWDRLGWKDTLAREENTQLQRQYASRGGEGAGVYTPQIVVQGHHGAVGSSRNEVRALVARAQRGAVAAVAIKDNIVGVAGKGAPGEVKLIALKSNRIVRIGNGENGGRVIRYSNIYWGERALGRWTGGQQSFVIPPSALQVSGADRFAVIVQAPNNGAILAGRYL